MAHKVTKSELQSVADGAVAPAAGKTKFATPVVETIAGIAAREVPGVFRLGGGSLSRAAARVAGTAGTTHGVKAEVGSKEIAIDLEMIVEYGYNVHEVAREVRQLVAERLGQMTGLSVKEVNIDVVDIEYHTEEPSGARVE
jgi:uncharacterized alkaline shock family protein YloU